MSNYPRPQASPPKTHYATESLFLLSVFIVFGIFATTLAQPLALGKLPLQFILKKQLHVPPSVMASFFFIGGFPWYLKPIAGILSDAFPLFRTRRRHYLLFSSVLAAVSWIAIGFVPHTYDALLWGTVVINVFMVVMSTVTGAVLVEVGQSSGSTGRLTAVRQFTFYACSLIQGPLGGLFASSVFLLAAGANAFFVISVFPVAYFLLKEKPEAMTTTAPLVNAKQQLGVIGRSGPFWISIVFIGLFYFAPGIGTLALYRQTDVLKLTPFQIGLLGSFGGLGGMIAAFTYGFAAKRTALRGLLWFGIITVVVGNLAYLYYNSYPLAFAIDFQNGLFFGFAECALIDLAARGTPAGCEGLGYSLMLSVRNFALLGADKLGATFSDQYHWSWSTMVIINAATTAIVLFVLPFMPKLLMGSRDGTRPNTENTGEPEAA